MRSAIFLVTALVAASTATPWGSRATQQCASYCKEASKFQYGVGTVYSYDYTGETASKIGGTSGRESRLHINAQAEFQVVSQCEFVLTLKRVRLEQSDPEDGSAKSIAPGSSQFAAGLERQSLVFSFQDGQIEHVCPSVDEPVWSLDVKRGILSAMQNSMRDLAASQLVFETDVVGHCETNYTVEDLGRNGVTVSRTKDLLACTGRNGQHSAPILSTPYSSASSVQSLPLLRSENECQQTIRNQLLEKSVCTETHLFRPFSNGQSGASTRVTQTLTYSSERRSDQLPSDFKKKKASLLFDGPDAQKTSGSSLSAIAGILDLLVRESQAGISPETPAHFFRLVAALRSTSYSQLSELFGKTQNPPAKKYLMDAVPLLGTAASYGLMRDMIQEGLLTDLEADMWLASLAFRPKPTLEMISAVSPLLADKTTVRPKALLSISALIHAYCRTRPSGCQTEEAVREAVAHIENHIGIACRSRDAEEQNTILLALKALGNAGLIVSSAETLRKCYQEETNPMVVRLAAIDAIRRVPCHLDDRGSVLSFYLDARQNSELRIGAYLAAMQCPSAQLLEEVKRALTGEKINQVGSFVWTHLTNLQESSSPSKQAVRQLLANEFLRNKFNTDARKFSRNLEASSYWQDLNVGGTVESNVVFSSQSYLPRSATLNLTLDLFGESLNLFELGARLEGFESLVESFFGPGGFFPDDSIQKVLETMRGKRAAPLDRQSLNQLSAVFDVRGQMADQPQGDLYLRVFGNELHTHRFNGLDQLAGKAFQSPLAMLLQVAGQKDVDFGKSLSVVDVSYVLPTAVGLPLTLTVNATATVAFKMGGTFQTASLSDVKVTGHVKPSGTIDINGLMAVDASTFMRSGVRVQNVMHTSTGLSGKVIIQGNRLVSVQMDAPEEATNRFSFDSRLFLLQEDGPKAVQPDQRPRVDMKSCSPTWFSRTFGAELCGELDLYPRTPNGPRGPLAGPAHAALYLRKTDKHSGYRFEYRREGSRSVSLIMDTPDSSVNRRLSAQVTADQLANSLRASFACPTKSLDVTGKYEYTQPVKGIDVLVSLDGAELVSVRTALRTDLKGPSGRYEPNLVVSKRGRELLNFQGYFTYVADTKYGFDFQLKHLTVRPIRLSGDYSKDGDNKREYSAGLKSYLLDATLATTLRVSDKLATSKTRIGYSLMEGTSHSLELSGKFNRAVKGSLKKTVLAGIVQSSQFPQYNGDLSWDLQQSENYLENSVRLNAGPTDQWEVQQLYSVQQRDVNVRLSVACKQQKVDFLIYTVFQQTDTTAGSQSGLRLSPGRQWSGKLDLTRQHFQPGRRYGGRVELISPTASRQLRADVRQETDKQWDLTVEYSANQSIEASVSAVYKDLSAGIKCDHSVEVKLRSWAADELDLSGQFVASPTSSQFNLGGRYGDRSLSGSVDYQHRQELEHRVSAKIVRDDESPVFRSDFNINAGSHKSLAVDIQAVRRITVDANVSPGSVSVQVFWNRDVDPSQSLAFTGKLSATGGDAQLKYKSWPPVHINVDKIDKDLKIQLEWNDNQAAVLRMELLPTRTAGLLTTPFDGFRRVTFDGLHQVSGNALDAQLTVDWQRDRFTVSVTGGKTAENVQGTFKLISTFAQLESVAAEFQALASQPTHRYSLAVQHGDRRAELSADYHRTEFTFKSASVNLVTPFSGYEALKASVVHNQAVAGFQTDIKLEGPFASRAGISASSKNVKSETAGNLVITTNFSVLETFGTSFQLFNKPLEKKLTVSGDLNGRQVTARAFTTFADRKFRGDLHLSSPFSDDIRATLNHRYEGQLLESQGYLSWAKEKEIRLDLDGQFASGQAALNASLSTPNWAASGRLDHKKVAGKMDTFAEAGFGGRRMTFTLNGQNLELDNIRLESKLTAPFQGFEDVRLNVQHRRDGKKTTTVIKTARKQAEITMEHDVEYTDLFNWVNRLAVRTPFDGLSSLTFDSKQLWTDVLEHDGQLQINGKRMTVALKADKSQPGKLTASGSLATSWSEDVTFELTHSDDGLEFHPSVIIRNGNGQPIRLETAFRRGPKNPSLMVEVVSPLSEPLKLSAAYVNSLPVRTANLSLNWNGDQNIDWNLDWALAALQSSVRTRLSTPFSRNNRIEADVVYDLTGQRKTAAVLLRRDDQTASLDAFAAGQGSGYQSQWVLSSSFYETVKASAVLDIAGARASLKLDRGSSQIHLHGVLAVAATQTALTATLETPFSALRLVKVDASLKSNRELQLDVDFDGQKISLTGSHSSGPAKGSLRASLKTPFAGIKSSSVDASYDASGAAKTASLTLSRNHNVIQASGQITLTGPVKLALNVRAPCCGIKHLDVTGSYDESPENKSGHLKLDLNGEKYQLDGKLIRSDGMAEVALKSMTGYQGYEQVVINAKYDVRQPAKTGTIAFSKNDERFHFSGTASTRSVVLDLATPIAPLKSARLEGRFDAETATLTLIRNEEVIKVTAGGSFGLTLGKLDCGLETPYPGWENLRADLVYDFQSPRKLIVLDAGSFRTEMEWNGRRLVIRSTTAVVGYEQLELTADYVLDNRELLAAIFLKKNVESVEIRFNGLLDLTGKQASFEFQSPVPFARIVSSKLKWEAGQGESKSFNLQAARNEMTMELEMNGRFVADNSALTVAGRSNIEGWNSASLSAAYDVRTSVSASLNLEKNGVHQSFAGQAKFDDESAVLAVQTPFEGMRTLGVSGRLVDASKVNVSSDRTATLHLEKDGQSQDYALALSFDANSAALSIETPFRNYEKMSAQVRFVLDRPQRTLNLVVKRNHHKMEFNGQSGSGEAELKLSSTLKGLENVMMAGRYDLASPAKTLALKLSLNEKTVQLNGSVDGLKVTIDLTTPFAGFEYVSLSGDVQLAAKTTRLMLELNGQRYEASGLLTDSKLMAQIKTPIDGFQVTDINGRWNGKQTEFGLSSSSLGKMILSTEYELDSNSLQFGRLVLNHNGIRYRNELVAKLADPWTGGEVLLGVQLPLDGLRNVTSTLTYDLASSEKSLAVTLDTSAVHYETTASVSLDSESGRAAIHVQTPVASWEEIDLSAGYDLVKTTVFVLGERNGKSVVFVQGLATLSAMSSILSSSVRVPALLSDDIEIVAAYNLGPDSVDAKIKYCAHEVLFDGQRSDGWNSAVATASTTFDQLQSAQINWNTAKKTASLHLNGLKATLDGRIQSPQETGFKATLSDPVLGTHSAEIEWNILAGKFIGRAEYKNGQNRRFGANSSVNFSAEKGDYQLTVHTGQAQLGDVQLIGSWASEEKIKSEAALHWAGVKKFEAVFDGQFSVLRSVAGLTLSSPTIRPVKTEIQYDFTSTRKSVKVNHNSAFEFSAVLATESMIQWSGKIDVTARSDKYSVTGKCNMEPSAHVKEFMVQLENIDLPVSQLRMTMQERNQRIVINASVNGPAFEDELMFHGHYDTSLGLNSSGKLSWAADKSIQANFLMSSAELSAELLTPFAGLDKTSLSVKYDLGQQKQTLDSVFMWSGRKITGSASWESMDGLVFSVRFTTPFQGFEEVGLRGTFLAGSDYTTTLYYTRAGKVIDIQGKLTSNAAGSTARITFAGESEQLSAVVEYDVRHPKKTASLTLSRGANQRISVTAFGEFSDKINGILSVETSSSLPIRISLEMDPIAVEKNGRLTVDWGQQQKLELMGSGSMTKTGSKFRLAAQTPFEGFKKILVNTRMNQKVVELSVEYGRNRKLQLNGQYRWDPKLSVYSLNGTLSTPWLEHALSGQSYLDLNNGVHCSASFSPETEKAYSVNATYRKSGSFEASVQSPVNVLRSAGISGAFETDSRKSSKRFAVGMEYNSRQASMEGRLSGLNARNAFVKGSWNNQAITLDTFYQNDQGSFKMAANVTTPFQGYQNWAGRFERTKQGQQCEVTLHLMTPLTALPSIDATVQTLLEAGKSLEIATSATALGQTGRAKLQVSKSVKTYLASLELDMPFVETLPSANIRAECQIDGWKNVVSTVTAGVPAGEYTVKGSMLMGKSSLNLNAGIKTPSFAKSIEMGAGYNAANLDLVQGEIFVWDNKFEGRYEKRGNQISVELSSNLPDLKLAHNRLNFEVNYRSPRQLQSSVSFITVQRTHTLSVSYQLAGSKFTGQLDLDSPVFQSKKTLSLKLNYGSLAAMTFDGKFVDGQSTCELTGVFRLSGGTVHSQAKLSCPMFGSVAIEVTGSPAEGKLTVTAGPSVHRLGYKLNAASDGYDVTMNAESPAFNPLHLRGIWMLGDVQQGQASLTVRHGDSAHSVLADYLRSAGDKTAGSFSLASPFLPGGQASMQLQYQPFDLNVQLDMLGQSHRLTGLLQRWPGLNGRIQLDSPLLPWKTVALSAQAERNVRDFSHGRANITASYGEQSLGLAGRFRYSQWSDFEGTMELNTPFQGLTMARADVQLSAINAQRVNASVSFQSSHVILPRASFNVQYQLNPTALDASATLNTPFSRWETVGLALSVPLVLNDARALASLSLPGSSYSVSGLVSFGRRQFLTEWKVDYAGREFATEVVFKADEIYQAKIDVQTPFRGFEKYLWDVKGQADVRRWGEATAFLDWNGKRIEFSSNVKAEPLAYIAIVQLNTPFVDFERYAVHLRLEGTDRKTLQVELESPGKRVGADFDYSFNSPTDFVGKASIRTPLAGYESFTVHLSNQLGKSSYSANAEARFADYGLAASVEGLVRDGGFQAQMDGRYNDRVVVLKAGGSLDHKRVTCNVDLVTPFEELKTLESFVQLEKDLSESKGFGLSVNGRQLILVTLARQPDGLHVLQVKNPWRPVDVSYSWENSADLIHYHAQLCWDLNRRAAATLGGRLAVRTSSYGRKISVKTVTPRREWSMDYSLELTSAKVDHSVSLSWAADRTVGYRVFAENGSSRRRTQLSGSVRLDLPARSFQLESRHSGGETTATHVEFQWDAARDPSRRLGGRFETRQGRQVRLIFLHPELERDIVLQGEYDRMNDGQLTGKMELIYSPLEEHRLVVEGSTTGQESARAVQLAVSHPASNTDVRLTADGQKTAGTEFRARLDYKDRSKVSRFLQLAGRVLPEQRRVDFEARTAEKSLSLSNALTTSGSSYALASRTLVNGAQALILDARLETSSLRPTLQVDGSYAGGESFNFLAGMPDRREITVRAVRDIHGREITDGHFQIKLNRTDLLSSRLYWRTASGAELRDAAVDGLVNVLAACESFADDLANFATSEWTDKRSSLTPTARLISQRLTESLNRELDVFRSEFKQMAVELLGMYERNDFYIRNIVATVKQVTSLAQPFIDRTVANMQAISRTLIGETAVFYRAAVSTYNSLAQVALSGYQQLSNYVSSGVSEVARYYSQLAGEVMRCLIHCESVVSAAFQRLQSAVQKYAGRLESVVMQQVDEIRMQLIEMANSYAEIFRPYTQCLSVWTERARLFYLESLASLNEMRWTIHERFMTYPLFQRVYSVYLEYASWLEEFHAQDYIDNWIGYLNQIKEEWRQRVKSAMAHYQPLIDPIVQAYQGQLDALKQLPAVVYINTVVGRLAQQFNELSKLVELEAGLRQVLWDVLQHTDRLTAQLLKDLKGSLSFPMKPTIVIDWEAGRLEYSQRLPFTWEDFGQLPRIRELPLLRKMATAKKNFIREVDMTQFYFTTMNLLAIYRPMRIESILPPFGSRAFVAGTQHYMTFDRRFYEFAGECSYLLASDFLRNDFSAVVNYEGAGGKVTRKSLTVLSDSRQIEIDSGFRVTLNGRKIEMPLMYESTSIVRDGQRLIVTNSKSGFRVDCNLYRDICTVQVTGWSFGKTGGLFGVYNNEPADDFLTPFRQLRSDDEVDSFANSWKVGTSRCRVRNFAVTRPAPSARNARLCDQLFADDSSVLRPCFQMVDPAPFARMCLNDLTSLENSPKKETGVCTAAAAYVSECRFAGLDLFVPPQCVRCELEDGKVIGSGEIKTFQNDAPRSADVVFIVDQKPCLNGTRLAHLPAAIDAALRERGIQQNRFAVVGYGGRGDELFHKPHVRTVEGGQIWSNRKGVQSALDDLPLADDQSSATARSDVHSALRYAVNLPYRVGVSKQFVLVSCGGSECQAGSYADTLTLLIENDVKLHLLQPRDFVVKGKNTSDELKNVFGFDAEEVYTVRNIRSLKGDRELRRQLAVPKDFCTPLALETNGTLFDLKKMMAGQQQQQQQIKKFVDIFARRVAVTGEPSPCQRCDCIGDRDGIGSILCQRCVSPIMERLDKVWEQLTYENEMANAAEVEDVTVSQIQDALLDPQDKLGRFAVATAPLQKR